MRCTWPAAVLHVTRIRPQIRTIRWLFTGLVWRRNWILISFWLSTISKFCFAFKSKVARRFSNDRNFFFFFFYQQNSSSRMTRSNNATLGGFFFRGVWRRFDCARSASRSWEMCQRRTSSASTRVGRSGTLLSVVQPTCQDDRLPAQVPTSRFLA